MRIPKSFQVKPLEDIDVAPRANSLRHCRLSRFRFRYKVAGSIPKVFAAASRLDARPKMLRI